MQENIEQPHIVHQAKEGIRDILHQHGKKLEKSALESEGFLFIPAENIRITPPSEKGQNGILEIREPAEKNGTESFDLRDSIEKAWPIGEVSDSAEWENSVFGGEISPSSFSPEIGGRICLTNIQTYETAEGIFVLMPIHPKTESKYQLIQKRSGQAKLSGTNMLRGKRFPSAQEFSNTARAKVTHNLQNLQAQNPEEKIVSQSLVVPTGLWNVRLINQKGKYSEIKNCHVQRDPSTGTLDLFSIQKQFIFDEFENFHPQENSEPERVSALIALDRLKAADENAPLKLNRVFFAGKKLATIKELPENYQSLFEEKENDLLLKNFQPTPPLKAFLDLERKVIQETPKDLTGEIRQKIGTLFEDLVALAIGKEKNSIQLEIKIPEGQELKTILAGQPEEFQNWALALKNKIITIQPDFILADGTFIETKAGTKLELKPEKRDQLFRIILYKLLKNEELKIRVISLEGETSQDSTFTNLQYENFFDTELAENVTEQDLKPIKTWQAFLPK
ncbi:MAG: hypothetical protein WAV73_00325 [Candidatus Moraniibacteriota bacterium]